MTTTQRIGRISIGFLAIICTFVVGLTFGYVSAWHEMDTRASAQSAPVHAGSITFDNGTVETSGVEVRPVAAVPVSHRETGGYPRRARGESYPHFWHRMATYVRAHGPACEYEDASGPRDLHPGCYWDASARGNGLGSSFVALNHGVTADGSQRVTYVYADGHIEFGGWGI